jgi:hypothetical protein
MANRLIFLLCEFLVIASMLYPKASEGANQTQTKTSEIILADDGGPVGLDDFRYSTRLKKVLVPAGRIGILALIDPDTGSLDKISGFSTAVAAEGARGVGITSVDESADLLLVTDRSARKLDVLDPATKKIISSADLASGPDYVRYVKPTNEIWVTEPHNEQLEVFSYPTQTGSAPVHTAVIAVTGGPEALVIDGPRARAYTNIDGGKTVAIDLKSRKIVESWPNGCESAEGAVQDDQGNFLFVACREGKVVTLDLAHQGKIISTIASGDGVDIIDFNPKLRHIYMPGSKSATLAIVAVTQQGELSLVKTVPSVEGGHCVTSAPNGNIYVCDPRHGKLLVIQDKP